jgi:hypothetical protein
VASAAGRRGSTLPGVVAELRVHTHRRTEDEDLGLALVVARGRKVRLPAASSALAPHSSHRITVSMVTTREGLPQVLSERASFGLPIDRLMEGMTLRVTEADAAALEVAGTGERVKPKPRAKRPAARRDAPSAR